MGKWKEISELSFELADINLILLDTLMDYCKNHDIPLYKEEGVWSLVRKARSIFERIELISLRTITSECYHSRKKTTKP